MYGELNVKPWELYRYTFNQVVKSIMGLRERDIMWQHVAKRMTAIIASTNIGGSKISRMMDKIWPIAGSVNKTNFADKAKALIKTVREREAISRANKKLNAGRIKNSSNG